MRGRMKTLIGLASLLASAVLLMAAADGGWLHRVPAKDHERANPLLHDNQSAETAAAAGEQVYAHNCAKCHGTDAQGRGDRPALVSDRIAHATDGDLQWIVTNGNPWKGMPPWQMLPEKQRWQVVSYLRSLNLGSNDSQTNSAGKVHP